MATCSNANAQGQLGDQGQAGGHVLVVVEGLWLVTATLGTLGFRGEGMTARRCWMCACFHEVGLHLK
jgi:hypothetical protein